MWYYPSFMPTGKRTCLSHFHSAGKRLVLWLEWKLSCLPAQANHVLFYSILIYMEEWFNGSVFTLQALDPSSIQAGGFSSYWSDFLLLLCKSIWVKGQAKKHSLSKVLPFWYTCTIVSPSLPVNARDVVHAGLDSTNTKSRQMGW